MIPGSTRDDGTFRWGEHTRVVKRPPRTDGFDEPNVDPRQNDGVERWECLDCGLTVQADRGLGTGSFSKQCPPERFDRTEQEDDL